MLGYREARVKAGLTMAEVAKKLNVSRTTIWLWETGRGNPLMANLRKMAEIYGCTMAELIREEAQ